MDDIEQAHEELKNDISQLKDQMAQMMEMLKSLEKKNKKETPSTSNGEKSATPSHPLSFTPMYSQNPNPQTTMVPPIMYQNNPTQPQTENPQETFAQPFPPNGLPPGYTPPFATAHQDNIIHTSTSNPPNILTTIENPSTQPLVLLTFPYSFPPPQNTNQDTHQSLNTNLSQPFQFTSHGKPSQGVIVLTTPPHTEKPVNHFAEGSQSNGKLRILEEKLQAIEGRGNFGLGDAFDFCPRCGDSPNV